MKFASTMQGVWTSATVAGGATSIIPTRGAPLPCTVTASPQDGDTLAISYSMNNGVDYQDWRAGAVNSAAAVVFDFPITQLRAVCTGTGTRSTVSLC